MELKASLEKPYTEEQRINFIIEQNHRLGYLIQETEEALEAWGKDAEELLEQAKEAKYAENESVRDAFLISGVVYKDILWDSDIEQKLNLSITVANMSETDTINWVGMDGVTSMECTKADLLAIGQMLTVMTTYVWQIKNPEIKTAIAEAKTIEEVEAIEIIYNLEQMVESVQPAETAEATKTTTTTKSTKEK